MTAIEDSRFVHLLQRHESVVTPILVAFWVLIAIGFAVGLIAFVAWIGFINFSIGFFWIGVAGRVYIFIRRIRGVRGWRI